MYKSGTFNLEDINEELIKEIVFFAISYPVMGEPGCVLFFTKSDDEYIISQHGTEWHIDDIVKFFPGIYEVYRNRENEKKDDYGFKIIGKWKIIPEFAGLFLVKTEYFDNFYTIYRTESDFSKKYPCCAVRLLFGKERFPQPDARMVYIKTQEHWGQVIQEEIERKRETEQDRLSNANVPWLEYSSIIGEGYIRFMLRRNDNGTFSGFRWLIRVQREQPEEGHNNFGTAIECYNLFLQKFEDIDEKLMNDLDKLYFTYVSCHEAGKFVRSYQNLEKAKEAVDVRNEWIGWGNVNKKNVHTLDYKYLSAKIEADSQICIF